jgi:hypothetical protein
MLYAVFNKRNQKEAEAKITDSRVEVKTLHSLGFAFIRRVWKDSKLDGRVEYARAEEALKQMAPRAFRSPELLGKIVDMVEFAKNTTIQTQVEDFAAIRDQEDIDFAGMGDHDWDLVALNAMQRSMEKDKLNRISFSDMVWLPVAMGWVRQWFNFGVVDETQDMSRPQLEMVCLAINGRIGVVGDRRQSIYSFRGAVSNGMEMMRERLKAKVLNLTVTYRCPKKVVNLAKEIVPEFKAASAAPEGTIEEVNKAFLEQNAKPGDAILSRLNAPLMPLALSFLRRNIPARIEGRNIGEALLSMVRSMKAKSVPDFIGKVASWREKQHQRLKRIKDVAQRNQRLEQADDIAMTLTAVAEGASSAKDVEDRIRNLFQDTNEESRPAVVLSSVHKAKGLEWERVFLLKETFRRKDGKSEEDNIWYVAITRTKKELFFVSPTGAGSLEQQKPAGGTIDQYLSPLPEPIKPASKKPDTWSLPGGHVNHKPGNVVRNSGCEWVCIAVNDCNARFMSVDGGGRIERFAVSAEPSEILRVMPKDELQIFLERGVQRSGGQLTKDDTGKTIVMSKKAQGKKVNTLDFIMKLAKDGKSEVQMTQAYKSQFEENPTAHVKYIIGREWRRVNGKSMAGKASKKVVAKGPPPRKGKPSGKKSPPARKKPAITGSAAKAPASSPPPRPAAPPPATPPPADPGTAVPASE